MKLTKSGKVRWQIRLPIKIHRQLKKLSKRTGYSMSELIRMAMRRYMAEWKKNTGEQS